MLGFTLRYQDDSRVIKLQVGGEGVFSRCLRCCWEPSALAEVEHYSVYGKCAGQFVSHQGVQASPSPAGLTALNSLRWQSDAPFRRTRHAGPPNEKLRAPVSTRISSQRGVRLFPASNSTLPPTENRSRSNAYFRDDDLAPSHLTAILWLFTRRGGQLDFLLPFPAVQVERAGRHCATSDDFSPSVCSGRAKLSLRPWQFFSPIERSS